MTHTERRIPARTVSLLRPRYLPWLLLALGTPVAAVMGIGSSRQTTIPVAASAPVHGNHYLGPAQLAESNAAGRREFADLAADAYDGRRWQWQQLSAGKPV